jgi:hypothetical protein
VDAMGHETNNENNNVKLENAINDVITQKLNEGIIEKLVAENLEKGINNSLNDLLGNYGDITKIIKDKIKSVISKNLEAYDFSQYITKIDHTLTEILKSTVFDHKKILENFKELMVNVDLPKIIKLSDMFENYKKFVAGNVDTGELEVDTDDRPTYESVQVTMKVEYEDERSWSDFKYAKVVFECEKDEYMNLEIRLTHTSRNDDKWSLYSSGIDIDTSIRSLKYLNNFKIYLLNISQSTSKIEIDTDCEEDWVTPDAEPETSYS